MAQDSKKKALSFIQQCNHNRRLFQNQFISEQKQLSKVLPYFLNISFLLYDGKYDFDCQDAFNRNVMSLMKMISRKIDLQDKCKQKYQKKFTLKWTEEKNKEEYETIQEEKKQNHYVQLKKQEEDDKRKKQIEFIPASSLPKGTSIRKKFVPPFKKDQKQDIKPLKVPAEGKQDEDGMDPRFKNLEAKLVQIIESEIVEKGNKVEWGQIAGLGFAKKIIHEMIVWPMLRPDIFTGLRAPPRGILLFGPPGTGKTMIGRAIASQASATFFSISASSLTSKWVGESQKLVRTLFAVARAKQPSVIFIDEIDSILCARKEGEQESSRRVKTQFLIELDGAKTNSEERILIIGATNLPQELDDAVRRRFVKRLYIPLPNLEGRKQLISNLTKSSSFQLDESQIREVASFTKGYSGADLYTLCSQAAMMPLRILTSIESIRTSEVPTVQVNHFKQALTLVRPSVNTDLLESFESWNRSYGSYQLSPDELEISSAPPFLNYES